MDKLESLVNVYEVLGDRGTQMKAIWTFLETMEGYGKKQKDTQIIEKVYSVAKDVEWLIGCEFSVLMK